MTINNIYSTINEEFNEVTNLQGLIGKFWCIFFQVRREKSKSWEEEN